MKKLSLLLIVLMMGLTVKAQEKEKVASSGKTHHVAQGETVMLISKKYLIKPEDIYKLNPEAVHGISANTVLQLPPNSKLAEKRAATTKLKGNEVSMNASPK